MDTAQLFPETADAQAAPALEWRSTGALNQWGDPRVTVRLLPTWSEADGWRCGWFAMLDRALDEWHPGNPDAWRQHAHYPWHRLAEMPTSRQLAVAAGNAARGVRIVLQQMLEYAEDPQGAQAAVEVSDQIERQAREWLTGAAEVEGVQQ